MTQPVFLRDQLTGQVVYDDWGNPVVIGQYPISPPIMATPMMVNRTSYIGTPAMAIPPPGVRAYGSYNSGYGSYASGTHAYGARDPCWQCCACCTGVGAVGCFECDLCCERCCWDCENCCDNCWC